MAELRPIQVTSDYMSQVQSQSMLESQDLSGGTSDLSKADVFKYVSDNLGVSYDQVESRYYKSRNISRSHKNGEELLGDVLAMDILNAPVKSGTNKGNLPQKETMDLISEIRDSSNVKAQIRNVVESVRNKEVNTKALYQYLKRALYAVANNRSTEAMAMIVRSLEMIDEER